MILNLRSPQVARVLQPLARFIFPLGFVALFAGYLLTTGLLTNSSDNASIVLEAQAMLHGNILLRGWYLPPDSFITTETPLDAILSIFFQGAQLFRITPALLYAATVTGAAYLATRRFSDPGNRLLAAGACVALLAFPIGNLFSQVLLAPIHMATILVSLLAWWAYDRFVNGHAPRITLGLFILATTLAIIGDPMAELLIIAPVGIVCGWILWRTRGHEMTARTLLISTVVALLLGIGLRQLLIVLGTHIGSAVPALSTLSLIWQHLQWLWLALCALFHINVRDGIGFDERLLFALLNGGFLVVGVIGFVRLFRRLLLPTTIQDSLNCVLSWAIIISVAAFLFSDFAQNIGGIRYLVPPFIYGGILCASAFAEVVSTRRLKQFVLAFLAVSVLSFGVALTQHPDGINREQPLIAFLEDHHLTSGIGTYWATNITTLRTDGQITVTPVWLQKGKITAYHWHASDDWFQRERLYTATFIVIDGTVPVASFHDAVVATFGAPDHVYQVGQYTIFAWDHPFIDSTTDVG